MQHLASELKLSVPRAEAGVGQDREAAVLTYFVSTRFISVPFHIGLSKFKATLLVICAWRSSHCVEGV